jgi:hypothetical protein
MRLAATIVGIMLMLALLLPTVKLLLPEPITCGMEHCLESGECCCAAHWADLRRQGETTIGSQEALTRSCPPNCAAPPTTSPGISLKSEFAAAPSFFLQTPHDRPHEGRIIPLSNYAATQSSPRSPPHLV